MRSIVIACFITFGFSFAFCVQHGDDILRALPADAFHSAMNAHHNASHGSSTKRSVETNNPAVTDARDEEGLEAQALKHDGENGFTYRVKTKRNPSHFNKQKGEETGQKNSTISKIHGVSIRKDDVHGFLNDGDRTSTENDSNRGFVTGIPDMSDSCFRRYANCIVINAQPYERRSSITLAMCKRHCIHSQIGVYSCRSFVYDNINQVCDLFGHAGDQPPARLLKFQTRDYYEPTFANECNPALNNHSMIGEKMAQNVVNKSRDDPINANKLGDLRNRSDANESLSRLLCPKRRLVRFLRTQGFELHKYDQWILDGATIQECLDACTNNSDALGNPIECHSVDFSKRKCILSAESAVPLGNGQLKLKDDTDYYEKICVDESIASECPRVFDRYPQMILVGFAEVVIDSPTFEHCFDNCLNSVTTHGIRCASGMYYYEEAQLNCILNVEDRTTQKDLFAEENSDIVDYFEIRCANRGNRKSERRFKARSTKPTDLEMKGKAVTRELKVIEEWSPWSDCSIDKLQIRTRSCGSRTCAREVRKCNRKMAEKVLNLTALKEEFNAKGISCAPEVCCPVFGGCRIGLIQSTTTRRLEWCQNPCEIDQQTPQLPLEWNDLETDCPSLAASVLKQLMTFPEALHRSSSVHDSATPVKRPRIV